MFKSIKTSVVALILVASAVIAHAQKKMTEGTLTYGLVYKLTEEQKAAMGGQEPPAELKVKFNNGLTKIEMEQGPALIGIVSDNNDKTGLLLIDVPIAQKQFAVKQSKEDIEKAMGALPKFSDFKATGEKQTVGGFNAEKYTFKDDKGGTHELWATKDVELPNVGAQNYFPGLAAFPVKYTLVQRGIETTTTLKSIAEGKVGPISKEVPTGYEVVTMEDLAKMQGGGE
ncbi:hypothetical protein G7074_23585 [Pedobacter sp. HDW13]|uniref:hypothetical protein n=1 Tax=unclassified Pedobacter TaxID=2628915 RepID=UPI000F5B0A8C|nr:MULTISPECIES: hypothetical protein [unclassified Pedobacter]QIL41986.1 hypothetical protein G7074_23585 [Pedobacter sp. HDW13]RQO64615.1 hypothetical protein DBR40_25220 [Pedobacter sp. KBW01]